MVCGRKLGPLPQLHKVMVQLRCKAAQINLTRASHSRKVKADTKTADANCHTRHACLTPALIVTMSLSLLQHELRQAVPTCRPVITRMRLGVLYSPAHLQQSRHLIA